MAVNPNYVFSENEMQDRGRWTPVYDPTNDSYPHIPSNGEAHYHSTDHNHRNESNDRSTPVNYVLPADILPTISKQQYNHRIGEHKSPQRSRNSHNKPFQRQRDSLTSTPEDPPQNPTIKDYSLANYLQLTSTKSKHGEKGEKKSVLGKYFSKTIKTLLLLLYVAYFVAVLVIPSKLENEEYWCSGDGLLIVLTVLGSYIFLYYRVIKPIFIRAKKIITYAESERVEIFPNCSCFDHWLFKFIAYSIFFAIIIGFLIYDTANERRRLNSLAGIVILVLCGFIFSSARMKIKWGNIIWAFGIQFVFGLLVLRWEPGVKFFECISGKVHTHLGYTDVGSRFIYGDNLIDQGIFAFQAMSVVIFFSLCIQVLYYYRIMQFLVMKIGWILKITVGTTACESVSASGNMFLGMTEAPLLVRPYLKMMSNSELHAVMTGGFATISGSVMAAFISFGVSAPHLVTASVMNAPAALAMSKIYRPETEKTQAPDKFFKIDSGEHVNVLHAALEGVTTAIPLVANICANLLAFIAFMAFADGILNWGCLLINLDDGVCSLSNGFGYFFMPFAFAMGIPWDECYYVGQLVGTKIFINEFVAYSKLGDFIDNAILSKRSEAIVTYALCGFGNISSIGVQIGGLGSIAPSRKADFARLAATALIAGCSATFMTACIAGTLISTPFETTLEFENITIGNETLSPLLL